MAKGNFLYVAVCFLSVLMCCCSPKTVYVPVERAVHDSVFISTSLLDRIVERDTVREYSSGDTVFVNVTRWRWRDREIHDTVMTDRVDSVPVPYEVRVPVPVERKLTAWEKVRLRTWWAVTAALVASLMWLFRVPLKTLVRRVVKV